MKRCPKCNRTFPDESQKFCTVDGGLLVNQPAFDPNATIQSFSPNLRVPPTEPRGDKPAGSAPPDFSATIAATPSRPTAVSPKQRGPAGSESPSEKALRQSQSASLPKPSSAQPQKKSKLPLILGILVLLLVLGVGAVVALFFFVIKPRLNEMQADRPVVTRTSQNENVNNNSNTTTTDNTPAENEFVAPPDTVKFANSQTNLEGKLAERFVDFSFFYPKGWTMDPKAGVPGASNFVKVERMLPPDFTQENFAVGWYTSKGTYEADESTYPQLVELLGSSLAKGFPEYRKVSEGPTKVNSLDGYEFRFESISKGTEKGDIKLWGRVIFVPTGVSGDQTGATLIMLATSLAPELSGVEDVGEKGEMPVILQYFRFGGIAGNGKP